MPSAARTRSLAGFAGSVLLHLSLGLVVVLYGRRLAERAPERPPADRWLGATLELAEAAPDPAPAPGQKAPRQSEASPEALGDERAPRAAVRRDLSEGEYPPDEGMAPDDALAAGETEAPAAPERPAVDDLAHRILAYRPKAAQGDAPAESAESASRPPAGPLGAEGASEAPRDFARAFTRAIPAANTADAAWDTLPLGEVGSLRFSVEVEEDGDIGDANLGKSPPPLLERIVGRTLRALRGGRFELRDRSSRVQRLSMTVTLSTHVRGEAPLSLGFDSPRPGVPGKAYFELPTGRRVDVKVELLP